MIHGDDVVLGVLPLFHVYGLNAVLGGVLRHRAKLVLVERFDPQGTLDLIEDEACSVVPVAPPVFAYWRDVERPARAARAGPADAVGLGAAGARAGRGVHRAHRHPGPPGLRPDRGRRRWSPARCAAPSCQPARSAPRCPGIEIRLVDETGRPPEGEDPGEIQITRRQPVQRLLARRRRRPRRRGLVGDRRRRLPRRHRRPVPGRPAQGAGDRLRLQRLPGRGRGGHPRGRRRRGGRGDRGRGRADRRGRGRLRRARPAPTRPRSADAVRAHCGQRLARFKQPSRVEVVDELPARPSPARSRRAGCAASSAVARSACSSER